MPDTWEPIKRVAVKVTGVDAQEAGLLDAYIELSAAPPKEWPHRFENPVGLDVSSSMYPPKVNGSRVTLHVQDDRMAEYVADVDARIAAANEYYENEVLPAQVAKATAEQDARDEVTRRIAEAQRIADTL